MKEQKTAKTITLLSIVIGYSLIDNLTALEQNALGNFFMEIGQILETNSAILQALNQHNNVSIDEINLIKKAIAKIENKLANITKKDID